VTYRTEWDDQGDEVLVLEDFRLPSTFHRREVDLAAMNLTRGVERFYLLVSRQVRFEAVQRLRMRRGWGEAFAQDPRRFSSTPRQA
jgi:hypothetical protein